MKYWWWITCKRQMASVSFLIILGMILLAAVVMRSLATRDEGIVRVLILSEEKDGGAASLLCDELLKQSDKAIFFEMADSEEMLRSEVKSGRAQGGYIFPEDFDDRLSRPDTMSELIVAVRSEAEDNARVVDEIVFAKLYDVLGLKIAGEYADAQYGAPDEARSRFITEQYETYKNDELPFRFELPDGSPHPVLDGDTDVMASNTTSQPVVGLVGILVVSAALSAGMMWYRDRMRGVFTWLSPTKINRVHLIYVLIPTYAAGLTGLLAVYLLGTGKELWMELLRTHWLIAVTTGIVFLLQTCIRSLRLYVGLIPVSVFLNLLCGGVFSELEAIPVIAWIKPLVPLSTYMDLPYGGRSLITAGVYLLIVGGAVAFLLVGKSARFPQSAAREAAEKGHRPDK